MADAERDTEHDGLAPATSGATRIPLPHGGHLTVRPVRADDADALGVLYDGLSAEDRERRFFSAYRPTPAVLERWARVAERGGARLVAVTDDGTIVGEAGYELLPDGDGELDITVARSARGWVGPYLLDALIDLASHRGVPNLEADVLLGNRQMIALARSRGYVALSHDEPCVVRLAMGTRHHPADWPGPRHGARVLVETRSARWPAEAVAVANGLQPVVCPTVFHPSCVGCALGRDRPPVDRPDEVPADRPVDEDDGCALVLGADALVVVVPARQPVPLAAIEAQRALNPHLVCFVQPTVGHLPDDQVATLPEGVRVLPVEPHDAVLALLDALGQPVDLPVRPPRP